MSATAQSVAEESATLLRNNGNALPLSAGDYGGQGNGGVLVMGPTAIAPYIGGGGSAHVTPYDSVQGPYDALRAALGADANVSYVPGYDLDGQVVPSSAISAPDPAANYPNWTLTAADAAFAGQPGLLRQETTTDAVASGAQPVLATGSDAAPDRLDTTINYTGTNSLPAGTAWRWSGLLTAPANPGGTGARARVAYTPYSRPTLRWPAARQNWGPLRYTLRVDGAVIGRTARLAWRPRKPLRDGRHVWWLTSINEGSKSSTGPMRTLFVDTHPPFLHAHLSGTPRAGKTLRLALRYADLPNPRQRGTWSSGVAGATVNWGGGAVSVGRASRSGVSRHVRSHRVYYTVTVTHVYSQGGHRTVTAAVTDRAGNTTTVTQKLVIQPGRHKRT